MYRAFFKSPEYSTEEVVDKFLFERHKPKKIQVSPVLAPVVPEGVNVQDVLEEMNVNGLSVDNTASTDTTHQAQLQKKDTDTIIFTGLYVC